MIYHGLLTARPLSRHATCASIFLRLLKRFGPNQRILTQFYPSVIKGVLSFGISVCFGGVSFSDIDHLEGIVRRTSCIVGGVLLSIASLHSIRLRSRARKIIDDPTHSANCLFELLPSGRRLELSKLELSRFSYSCFHDAVFSVQL